MTLGELRAALDALAPYDTQCDWDNSGVAVCAENKELRRILLALDCTNGAVRQARELGCEAIVTHHPLIFRPVRAVSAEMPLYAAIRGGVSVISAHTNLDMADGGVNDALAQLLELSGISAAETHDGPFLRMGTAPEQSADRFAAFVAEKLDARVSYSVGGGAVRRVAVCGGAGGDMLADAAAAGCDALVTGEAKHHEYILAQQLGMTLFVAGHFETEWPVMPVLERRIREIDASAETFLFREDPRAWAP